MRKVYHGDTDSRGLAGALAISLGITAVIFCIIPFSHLVNKPTRTLELRKTSAADLPPPADDKALPPEKTPEKPQETAPEPQLAESQDQAIPITADLDVAMGSGAALAGYGADVRAMTSVQAAKEEAFDVSELERRPEPVAQVAPVYPAELRKAKIEGQVTLLFVLTEEGRVEDPRVENASRPEFEKPALDAIRRWRFRPGMKNGQAVRSYIRIPMRFRVSAG